MAISPFSGQSDARQPDVPFDIRGWSVVTLVDDQVVGKVHDLLLDERGTPRYLDVDLGRLRKHVLLPVGQARADRTRRLVWVPGLSQEQFDEIPAYHHDLGRVDRDYESALVAAYVSAYSGEDSRPRPSYAGTVYGPSELEDRVRVGLPPLEALSRMQDYEVASDDPDPRGWPVRLRDGTTIGTVDDLVVDTRAMKVRYLICLTDGETVDLSSPPERILVPIGYARLDEDDRSIRLDLPSERMLDELPSYEPGEIESLLEANERLSDGGAPIDDGFYDDPRFNPRTLFGGDEP